MIFNKNFKILIFTQLKAVAEPVPSNQRRRRVEKETRRMEGKEERRSSRREKGPTTAEVILKNSIFHLCQSLAYFFFVLHFMYSYSTRQRFRRQ